MSVDNGSQMCVIHVFEGLSRNRRPGVRTPLLRKRATSDDAAAHDKCIFSVFVRIYIHPSIRIGMATEKRKTKRNRVPGHTNIQKKKVLYISHGST